MSKHMLMLLCVVSLQAPGYGDVRLSLEYIQDTVNIEEPFDITCKITNCRCEAELLFYSSVCSH